MSDRAWVLKYQLECDKVQCGQTWIALGRLLYQDILFLCPRWSSGPDIYRNFLIWAHFVNASCKKIGLTHAHFQCNLRKLVNVVKVRFTMMYSSRKLNNKKVITTACNFWRQIACSFQVYGCTSALLHQVDSKISVLNFPLFFTWPTLTSQAVFSHNFSDRSTKIRAKKQQFLIANISEILASIELKLHIVCLFGSYLIHFTRIELK